MGRVASVKDSEGSPAPLKQMACSNSDTIFDIPSGAQICRSKEPTMADELYKHVRVPGFGCTYQNDFVGESASCIFELHRLTHYHLLERSASNPRIVLAIEGGKGKLTLDKETNHTLDNSNVIIIPRHKPCSILALSPILKVMMLEVRSPMISQACREYGLDNDGVAEVFETVWSLTRTNWLNEVFHRYCFERAVAKRPESLAAVFLEAEMIKEIFYSVAQKLNREQAVPYFKDLPEPLQRALTFIESNLHNPVTAEDLSSASVVSKPTLVRLFRSHLDASPVKYLWDRRLDEADRLLLTGRYTVAEVAEFLCFSDGSSLSKSYVERFGVRPSTRIPVP
jgi:AraC-like DNA-binding protein